VARAEAYPHTKFHLDPSNRLATIHQRHRQIGHRYRTDRTGQRSDSIGRTVLQTVAENGLPDAIGPLSVLSCLSVAVYCGQTVVWIKMPLGTEMGLDPSHIVLDGDSALPTERGRAAPSFRPTLLWHGRPSQPLLSSCCESVRQTPALHDRIRRLPL